MRFDWWTLALQTVNVLVLIWILARFFFRPIADIVARRQAEASKLLSDAAAARQAAGDACARADQARTEISAERDRLIAAARKGAAIEQENLRMQVSEEIAKLRRDAEAAIARDRVAAEQAIVARAGDLAVEIAQHLLGRLPPEAALPVFLEGLCRELRALSPEARASFASATVDHPVEVVTTTPLSDEEMGRVRDALTESLGPEIPFTYLSNPALIAGIELHGRSTIVRNSWRADLDRIREELDRDNELRGSR
jgi:F-type H+-transporting ATPase subunit b